MPKPSDQERRRAILQAARAKWGDRLALIESRGAVLLKAIGGPVEVADGVYSDSGPVMWHGSSLEEAEKALGLK